MILSMIVAVMIIETEFVGGFYLKNDVMYALQIAKEKAETLVLCNRMVTSEIMKYFHARVVKTFIHHPILIWFYPRKRGWQDLPNPNSNLSNSHSPSCSTQGILLLQTNTLALLLHLHLPRLGSPRFLLLFTFNSSAFLKICPSFLLNTCVYYLTP